MGRSNKYVTIGGDLGGLPAVPTVEALQGEDLPDSVANTLLKRNAANDGWVTVPYSGSDLTTDLAGKAASSHSHAQSDVANLVADLAAKATADTNCRVAVGKNDAAATGTRRKLNFKEGSNVTLTIADDSANEEVDITIAASGGGSTVKHPWYFRQVGTSRGESWYLNALVGGVSNTSFASETNKLFALPFFSTTARTVDRIAFRVVSGVASSAVIAGIYSDTSDTDHYPASLLVSGSAQDCSTTGAKSSTVSQVIAADTMYWLVINTNGTGCTLATLGTSTLMAVLGWSSALTAQQLGWHVARTYDGTLPSSFPAGASVMIDTDPKPAIWLRFSA